MHKFDPMMVMDDPAGMAVAMATVLDLVTNKESTPAVDNELIKLLRENGLDEDIVVDFSSHYANQYAELSRKGTSKAILVYYTLGRHNYGKIRVGNRGATRGFRNDPKGAAQEVNRLLPKL